MDGPGHLLIADSATNVVWLLNLGSSATTLFGQTIPPGSMARVAGSTSVGFSGDGGPAGQATLYAPSSVALDRAGNLYIADTGNQRIREVLASTGIITTVAGTGRAGFGGDGGPAVQAALYTPSGVTLDAAGNLYIADTANNRVREVLAAGGVITTVAGTGTAGYGGDGGAASAAQVSQPNGLAVDGAGNLYIADTGTQRVREVLAASGVITTVAGTGTVGYGGDGGAAAQAALDLPTGVALDGAGNLFIADSGNNRIREVLAGNGVITTVAGDGAVGYSGDGDVATQAQVYAPFAVAVDGAGDLFVADTLNSRVRVVLAGNGIILTVAGGSAVNPSGIGDGGLATQATLAFPAGVTLDGNGDLFIADRADARIREVLAGSSVITTVAGNGSPGCTPYSGCLGGDGGPATSAQLNNPSGTAVDSAGNLYIADSGNHRIREVLAASGLITTAVGGGYGCPQQTDSVGDGCPPTQAHLQSPIGVALDGAGNLFIADSGDYRVREVLAATGLITTVAGTGTSGFSGDGGPAVQAQFNYPAAVAVDGAGDLFVADYFNNRVREVLAASGVITTVAGSGAQGYGGDGGRATRARLSHPDGVAVSSLGNLFIADSFNNRIRDVISTTGVITTVAGSGVAGYSGDGGVARQALLNMPGGVALDGTGNNLYIVDTDNNRLRMVRLH